MPYFTDQPTSDDSPLVFVSNLPSELVTMMNTRFDNEVQDINDDETFTPEEKQQQIRDLADGIISDAEAATDEEIALLYYLHTEEDDKDAWFDDLTEGGAFWERGTIINQGRNTQYAVVDSDVIDEVMANQCREYVDECILSNSDSTVKNYFDYDKFTRDATASDGYGHCLATYDGNEYEITIGEKTWYVFRLN